MVAFPTFLTSALDPNYILSLKKRAYVLDSGVLPVNFADGDAVMVWFRNDSPDMDMIYMYSHTSWNGGDTNHNRACLIRGRFGMSVPTAGHVVKAAGPLNGYNAVAAPLTSYVWDGVTAGGITVADKGVVTVTHFNGIGNSDSPSTHASVVIPPGGVAGCSFEPEEDGKGSDIFFLSWVKHNSILS